MMSRTENPHVYTELSGLNAISRQGRENSAEGMRQVAEQFEAIFLNMMLKQMREGHASLFEDNYLSSNEMEFHQENFDNQMSVHLAGAGGIGLADTLHRQLMSRFDVQDVPAPTIPARRSESVDIRPRPAERSEPVDTGFVSPEQFVERLMPLAEPVAAELGVHPHVLLAQSALETGWGKKVPGNPQGGSSHNLFGIKADAGWEGEQVNVNTLEYRDGIAQRERASFRSYASWEDSFADYADFLRSNPRYAQALEQTHDPAQFVEALQQAGYATDPIYAEKINRVMGSPALQTALHEGGSGNRGTLR